jgi:acylphosphatase
MAGRRRVHLHITGRVQGVSFRWYARHQATKLQLSGWVRNLSDGSVEAAVEGEDSSVRQFIAWTRHGPSMAQVDHVDVQDKALEDECFTFQIRD